MTVGKLITWGLVAAFLSSPAMAQSALSAQDMVDAHLAATVAIKTLLDNEWSKTIAFAKDRADREAALAQYWKNYVSGLSKTPTQPILPPVMHHPAGH
jgi:hypothetical protein